MPSGKIRVGDSPEATVVKEMKEELEQIPQNYTFRASNVTLEPRASPSCPGLPTIYEVNHFEVLLNPSSTALRDNFSVDTGDPDEGVLYFEWEHQRMARAFLQ
ncbi:hypothetical protein A3A03_00905 [Candidatus Nomurabacteria bacterium RIFCSPLOWO2_01_FULL_40_18]|uniref:Nudix hydrolase domain-containing protein n=1 Tax=Candidatus Nomurabacteria bacterium RIFCSPLOWO2_01_FULL_40_18 TaxID=1801773 RepID=A0A1F6XHU3_9BACT|nr:MAG: hypothetical protein A3A03_00905 [Candidatus Nomurabacteria bacterium RIFCSPLOWO2_01_FULL_40_18]